LNSCVAENLNVIYLDYFVLFSDSINCLTATAAAVVTAVTVTPTSFPSVTRTHRSLLRRECWYSSPTHTIPEVAANPDALRLPLPLSPLLPQGGLGAILPAVESPHRAAAAVLGDDGLITPEPHGGKVDAKPASPRRSTQLFRVAAERAHTAK